MIFYFSGTGNSLYVAKKLAESLGEQDVYSIANEPTAEQIGGKNEKIGFVFPSYYGNLPRIVRKFISRLNIHHDTYIFGIVTMGGGFGEGSITALERFLTEKGITLHYGRGILMPANYIVKYNPMFISRVAKTNKYIKQIFDDIKAQKNIIKKNFLVADNLYKNIELLDENFFAENNCTECGQCVKICPVENIKLVEKKPEWQHNCEHCMTCIHWCPQQAIQYGTKTKKRKRYHNPNINVKDIIKKS